MPAGEKFPPASEDYNNLSIARQQIKPNQSWLGFTISKV